MKLTKEERNKREGIEQTRSERRERKYESVSDTF